MLTKTSAYVKSYDGQTKWMYFLIEDDDFWDKVSADVKKEPIYNKEFLETKKKSHSDEVTDFYDKKVLRYTLIIFV